MLLSISRPNTNSSKVEALPENVREIFESLGMDFSDLIKIKLTKIVQTEKIV